MLSGADNGATVAVGTGLGRVIGTTGEGALWISVKSDRFDGDG